MKQVWLSMLRSARAILTDLSYEYEIQIDYTALAKMVGEAQTTSDDFYSDEAKREQKQVLKKLGEMFIQMSEAIPNPVEK